MTLVTLQAAPQRLHHFRCTFDALHKHLFGVEQMARDAETRIFSARFAEHVEEVQATQGIGGFGSVEQTFEHGMNAMLRSARILLS